MVRFDQRGCGRSSAGGPYTIAQAVEDLDQLRATNSPYRALPHVERIVLGRAGHAPRVERPGEALAVLLRALEAAPYESQVTS